MPTEKRSRKQAVKAKCLDCSGGVRSEVRKCPATNCPLWLFRMGSERQSMMEDMTDTEATEEV